jgi:hypothetical protein
MLEKFTAVMTEDGASMNHTWHVTDHYRELAQRYPGQGGAADAVPELAAHMVIKHKTMDPLRGAPDAIVPVPNNFKGVPGEVCGRLKS